jgi:hypothetical protein
MLRDEFAPVESHVIFVNNIVKFMGAIAGIVSFVYVVISIVSAIGR